MEDFSFESLLLRWYKFLRKNIVLLFASSVIFGVLAFVAIKLKKPDYESTSVMYSSLVDAEQMSLIVEDISMYIKKGSENTLSEILDIPLAEVSSLKDLQVSTLPISEASKANKKFNLYGENCVLLELQVKDPLVIEKFQNGLSKHLDNNDFLNKIGSSRKKSIEKILLKIDEQIKSLEEFQKKSFENTGNEKSSLVINNELQNASLDMILLVEKKSNYEEMSSLKTVEFIKPFMKPDKPESKTFLVVLAGLIIGYLFGLFIALLRKVESMNKNS